MILLLTSDAKMKTKRSSCPKLQKDAGRFGKATAGEEQRENGGCARGVK